MDCVTPAPVSGLYPGFGGDGKVSTAAGGRGQAVAVQPDGRIVTAGGASDFTLTRHQPDGELHPSFGGGDGIVSTNVGGPTRRSTSPSILRAGSWSPASARRTSPSRASDFRGTGDVGQDIAVGPDGNRDIAQALYVSPKTVEQHLTAAYRKLGVGARENLPGALAKE